MVTDRERVPRPPRGDFSLHSLALGESAKELGDPRVANLVGLGALTRLGALCSDASLDCAIRSVSPNRFVELNLEAARVGRSLTEVALPAGAVEIAEGGSSR